MSLLSQQIWPKDSYQAHCNIKVSASIVGWFILLVSSVILGAVGSSNFTVLPGDFWRNPLVQTFKQRFESFFNVGQCNIRRHAHIHPVQWKHEAYSRRWRSLVSRSGVTGCVGRQCWRVPKSEICCLFCWVLNIRHFESFLKNISQESTSERVSVTCRNR